MDVEIPEKLYFKIGEVSQITGVKPHVLRYWESEFGSFSPVKSRSKQRLYRRKDIETALRIKDLLYNQGFTISGAQKILRDKVVLRPDQEDLQESSPSKGDLLSEIRRDLLALREMMRKPVFLDVTPSD